MWILIFNVGVSQGGGNLLMLIPVLNVDEKQGGGSMLMLTPVFDVDENRIMDFAVQFRKLGVYKRLPRSWIQELNSKLISTKWLDSSKGDRQNPNHRSRLVEREYNEGRDGTLFASTPPIGGPKVHCLTRIHV